MQKIVVIDDAEFILESTSTLLRFEGYEIVTASDGIQGVEKIFKEKPNLILCDISMPGMDGFGVLEKVRESPETQTIPFIFLTAFTDKANMRAGMERGADDFLVKPFTREELIKAINAQIRKLDKFNTVIEKRVDELGKIISNALPHEFRTVLNQIVGSAKYITHDVKQLSGDEIVELAEDILVSAERLNKITENYLIFTRIESFLSSPKKREQLRKFRTDEPAAILVDIASNIADRYGRGEDIDLEGSVSGILIEVSSESYFKVISELLDNAFKFSAPKSPVTIKVWMEDSFFFISITDKGMGFNEKNIQKIGAYMQFDRNLNEQQGIGLGLAISKKLVELHDGFFSIESSSQEGTVVVFSFPSRKLKSSLIENPY